MAQTHTPNLPRSFVVRCLFILALVLLTALAIRLASLWILAFGAVVIAVVLRAIADPLDHHTPIKGGFAVLAAALTILAVVAGMGFLFGREATRQFTELSVTLPSAWETLQARLTDDPLGERLLEELRKAGGEADSFFAIAPKIAGNVATGVAGLFLVFVAGVYLAVRPQSSRDGVVALLPKEARPRACEVLNACGKALKGWLSAQIVSMILVGGLIAGGLTLIGLPSPLVLGLAAGVAQFVPILGPVAASVPALLVAATAGGTKFLLTLALFVGVSQLESNLITPLVQKNVASLPVIFGIFAVIAFASLFGLPGALFATPLALVVHTLVIMLYRQDVLGDRDVLAPGQKPADKD